MRVLVTGASGFLGAHVAAALSTSGHDVIGTSRNPDGSPRIGRLLEFAAFRAMKFDLRHDDAALLVGAVRPDAIVHCAAYGVDYREQDPIAASETNVTATVRLWSAAHLHGVPTFVHIGTCYEFGSAATALSETAALQPTGIYGCTKAAASLILRHLGREASPRLVVMRPFYMYGPGDGAHKLVPQVMRAIASGSDLELTAGDEVRDVLFVRDVAARIAGVAVLDPARIPAGSEFNVCSGVGIKVRTLVESIAEVIGRPCNLRFGARPSRVDTPSHVVGDASRWRAFCNEIGRADWLEITPLAEAARQTFAEYST